MPTPKLSRIPGSEATVKQSFSLKKSTSDNLQAYLQFYCKALGLAEKDVSVKDVVEQILIDFMSSDKEFQRSLAEAASKPAKPASTTAGGVLGVNPAAPSAV